MELGSKESVWTECQAMGEAAVKARLEAGSFGGFSLLPKQWLLEKEAERQALREAEDRARNDRTMAASEASARASEKAAEASLLSARWTMWAAIAALASVVMPLIAQYFAK